MPSSPDLLLNEHLGLLRALCERKAYFAPEDVKDLETPLKIAAERYGTDGVPPSGAVFYARWGDQPIMAGILTEPSDTAALPYLRCAAVAQQLLGTRGVDMLVLLIGPDGSSREDDWVRAAAAIEDDDRICRKLVWLPDGDLLASAENLLTRSPFARPWRGAASIEAQAGAIDELLGEEDELDDIAFQAESGKLSAVEFVRQALLTTSLR